MKLMRKLQQNLQGRNVGRTTQLQPKSWNFKSKAKDRKMMIVMTMRTMTVKILLAMVISVQRQGREAFKYMT